MIKAILKNGSRLLSRRQSSIFSAATILAATFSVSAILGILRDRLLYARFYACCASQLDAYNGAFRIPDIIFRLLVTGALSAAFIPVFSEQLARNKKEAYRTASSVINILFLVLLVLVALVIIFSYPLSALITSGFTQEQVVLMSQLTRVMVFAQLFFLLSNFLTGVLQSYQRFLLPALAPVAYNLGIIFGIQVLAPYWGIFGPALGVVIGAGLHFFIQLPLVLALGFDYLPIASFRLALSEQVKSPLLVGLNRPPGEETQKGFFEKGQAVYHSPPERELAKRLDQLSLRKGERKTGLSVDLDRTGKESL